MCREWSPGYTSAVRRAPGTYVEWVGDEAVVLREDRGTVHYLNRQAALVYALILEHGEEEAKRELGRLYRDAPKLLVDTEAIIRTMVDMGLLVDE